jgi:hypothetical protein
MNQHDVNSQASDDEEGQIDLDEGVISDEEMIDYSIAMWMQRNTRG